MSKNYILLIFVVLYLATGLLGYKIGWSFYQYDELRLLQFPLAVFSLIYLIFSKKFKFSLQIQLIFLVIGLFIFGHLTSYDIFQLQELISVIALLLILVALTITIKETKCTDTWLAIVIFSASIPCLFIFVSIFNFINEKKWFDWQFNSGSIRIYDSVIVPLFFFLIFLKKKNYPYSQCFYPIVAFLFALAWFFDAARSALLSVMVGLAILFIFSKFERRLVVFTLLYMLLAFLLYKWTYYSFEDKAATVLRVGTSKRAEMWLYMFEQWRLNPVWGTGGGYLSKIQYLYGHHIHSFYLRLIFEWGIIGLLFLGWMIYQIILLLKDKNVELVLKAGVVAILVDAMFSGNMVYPLSQMACILFIAFAFSKSKVIEGYHILNYQVLVMKILIILWGVVFFYLAFTYFKQDLTCWDCGSNIGRMAPNFWFHGGTEHLIPSEQIK